jgi:hypothetical protein
LKVEGWKVGRANLQLSIFDRERELLSAYSYDNYPTLWRAIGDIGEFSEEMWPRWQLRAYQERVAREIVHSVARGEGRQFAVVFARQSGKDEMLAQLEAYLMCRYRLKGGSILVVNPTLRPQGLIGKRRLLDRLGIPCVGDISGSGGYTVGLGKTTCGFLSASPLAQARGETASLLLACNEAQDVAPDRWDAVFDPMGAAHHATQVFSGTVWTSRTLLARQMAYLGELERKDGTRRVFKVGWEEIAEVVPQYGEQVRARIAQFGRDHPFIRTEYFLEELDAEGKLFGPARRAQMRGTHPRHRSATPGKLYALLVDVAGADELKIEDWQIENSNLQSSTFNLQPRQDRDATALTVVEVDLAGLDDPLVLRPSYRVVDRRLWVGTPHPQLHAAISDLARNVWSARWVVVDATGVGAGLAGFLGHALPGKVVPFVFTAQSKSQLGWDFLGLIDSGRYKEYAEDGAPETGLFWTQVEECGSQVSDAPGKLMRWGVESRSTHDDLLISAALCAVLDRLDWRPRIARGR